MSLLAARASAVEYEIPIDIAGEDDLYELRASEQISDDTFNALLELLHRGVDLDEADVEEVYALPGVTMKDAQAIVAYRKAAGGVPEPQALVAAGIISAEELGPILPFLASHPHGNSPFALAGLIRARTLFSSADDRVPTASLDVRVQTLQHLTLGVSLLLVRDQVSDVRWDPTRSALSALAPEPQVQVAKVYADWRTPGFEILVGNFRAGFAQRLVFDDTTLYTPNGFYPDEVLYRTSDLVRNCNEAAGELAAAPCPAELKYVTPDLRFRDGLFGVAVALRQVSIDDGWLQVVGFVSRQVHAIYQYELYDRDTCADPASDSASCAAPAVYRRLDDLAAPTSRFTFQTLPDMWAEPMAGGNVTFFFNRRTHVGITGYGARPEWLVEGTKLDFQEWSRWPLGGAYGAVGADAAWGADIVDIGVEIARSLDSTASGGGLGAIARATLTWPRNELELSLRYYDEGFANPYTGSIAEPDVVDGQRARDEAGVRLRFAGRVSDHWDVRTLADVWVQPSANVPKVRLEARTDYVFERATALGVYARWEDKDLRSGGFGACYDQTVAPTNNDENGEPIPCAGQRIDLGVVGRAEIVPHLVVTAQLQNRYLDDPHYTDSFRQDLSAWLSLSWAPTSALRLYARARLLDESVDDAAVGEESLWGTLEASLRPPPSATIDVTFRLRYDIRSFLDDRQSTHARVPNPEHWFRLEVESRF